MDSKPVDEETEFSLKDGPPVYIRRICAGDEPAMVKFHVGLSAESIYYRYFAPSTVAQRTSHSRLQGICSDDGGREYVLVAHTTRALQSPPDDHIAGIGRLSKMAGGKKGEFAIIVSDKFQHHGLGAHLLHRLIDAARHDKMESIFGLILRDNRPMLQLCKHLGFAVRWDPLEEVMRAELDLTRKPDAPLPF